MDLKLTPRTQPSTTSTYNGRGTSLRPRSRVVEGCTNAIQYTIAWFPSCRRLHPHHLTRRQSPLPFRAINHTPPNESTR
ncbi:hypothetical protein E2C01_086981 [Portunus trituberculatus]|uniref:Uncharacterized protein n=1 Tax=Portunus trituberculatus TaxID=210409 RepID=A0A5B7JG37_PORTR|nr:hypothetical protein [Portunus trituberculatus]